MKAYEGHLNKVNLVANKLISNVSEAESRFSAFQKLTEDVIERIQTLGSEHFLHFLKLWFRTFLGMRDECMILITGEIVRSYHIEQHRDYLHERNRESHYYNSECSLSMCSTDGVDFEYRNLRKKYGNKSAFEKVAKVCDAVSPRVHELYKSINACHERLQNFIKTLKVCNYDADLESFCAESIEVTYLAGDDKKRVTLSGQAYRKYKKAQALSTVLEDPPNVNVAPTAASRTTKDHQAHRKSKIRVDLEDSDDEIDVAPSSNPMIKTEPKLALDFQFTASLEAIKNSYNPPPEHIDPLVSIAPGTAANALQPIQQPAFLSYSQSGSFCLDSPEVALLKVRVVSPLVAAAANPQDITARDYVNLTLPVHHVFNLLDSKVKDKLAQHMLATDLLDEITKLLWLSPLQCVDDHTIKRVRLDQHSADSMCRIWLPKLIQIDRSKYSRGSVIPLPESLSSRRFAVICEADSASADLCNAVQKWVHHDSHGHFIKDRQQVVQRQKLAFEHKEYVLLLARYLRKIAQDPQSVLHLNNQFVPCQCCMHYDDLERKLCHSFKMCVLQHTISPTATARTTKISSYLLGPDDFFMLCRHSDSVTVETACLNMATQQTYTRSLSSYMTNLQDNMLDYQWKLQKLCVVGANAFPYLHSVCGHSSYTELVALVEESMSIRISSLHDIPNDADLDMMFDVMLEALDDRQWRDAWCEVIECICVHSPNLTALYLENVTSSNMQLLVLLVGIVRAMQRRQEVVQQDAVYCLDSNISEEKEKGFEILKIAQKRLGAASSPRSSNVFTITIREKSVLTPSLLDIAM